MNEKIYTIPVMEGLNEPGECPFCFMKTKLERSSIEFTLGPSYMENDVRDATNELGFCEKHLNVMYYEKNILGLSLMVHTHLQYVNKQLDKLLKDKSALTQKKKLFAKENAEQGSKLFSYLDNLHNSCYVCNKVNSSMERYFETFFYLYEREKEISELIKKGNGMCLPHFQKILQMAPNKLQNKVCEEFITTVVTKQQEALQTLSSDLDWFTQKFDYRFKDEPWRNSKDALPRAIQKISSHVIKN